MTLTSTSIRTGLPHTADAQPGRDERLLDIARERAMRDEIETTIKTRRTTMNPENEIDKTEALEPVETAAANVAEARGGVDGRSGRSGCCP